MCPSPAKQPGGGIEADPARAGQIHLGPGVQIGEVALGAGRTLERLLVGLELDQVARDEARREAEVAEHLHEQPRAVAARARSRARASPPASARRARGGSRSGSRARARGSGRRGSRRCGAACGRSPASSSASRGARAARPRGTARSSSREPRLVVEREALRRGLEEEVERVLDRELGDEVDVDLEVVGPASGRRRAPGSSPCGSCCQFRKCRPARAGASSSGRRAAVRRRAQPHDLRRERHPAVVAVAGQVVSATRITPDQPVSAQLRRILHPSVSLPPRRSEVAASPALRHSAKSGTARHIPLAARAPASTRSCTKRSFWIARGESTNG